MPLRRGKKFKKCCYTNPAKAAALTSNWDELADLMTKPMQVYKLKVTLVRIGPNEMSEEVSRTVEMLAWETLHELHREIQSAFQWDDEHLYSFYFCGKLFDSQNEYAGNPFGEPDGNLRSAADTELRDLKLKENSEFLYLFDYGDELVHNIKVEAVRYENEDDHGLPAMIGQIGSPPQYPEWQ